MLRNSCSYRRLLCCAVWVVLALFVLTRSPSHDLSAAFAPTFFVSAEHDDEGHERTKYSERANRGEGDSTHHEGDYIETLRKIDDADAIKFTAAQFHPNKEALSGGLERDEDLVHGSADPPAIDLNAAIARSIAMNPPAVGASVVRGPHFAWGDVLEEGKASESPDDPSRSGSGLGVEGTIVAKQPTEGWWRVRWVSGRENSYRWGDGHYDFIVVSQNTISRVIELGSPPVIEWEPSPYRPFAPQVAALDQPAVLTNTSASTLPAVNSWSLSSLKATCGDFLLQRAKAARPRATVTPFFYYHDAPLTRAHVDVEAYARRAYAVFDATLADVIDNITASADATSEKKNVAVWAGKLDDFCPHAAADVFPLLPLIVPPIDANFSIENEHLYRQTHIWLAGTNTSTPLHMDLFHNFYVQISGRKKITLFPPSDFLRLYLHPISHPAGRSSQIDLDLCAVSDTGAGKDSSHHEQQGEGAPAFPLYDPTATRAQSVILNPGEVLYIPPYWFHHVVSLEPSISMSVWSNFGVFDKAAKAVEQIPLPIKTSWTQREKVLTLRIYLESIIENLSLGMNTGEFVFVVLLDNRFKHIGAGADGKQVVVEENGPFCDVPATTTRILSEYGDSFLRQYLEAVVSAFKAMHKAGGVDRLLIELGNYFEISAISVVGVAGLKQFLHDLAFC